MFREIRIVSYLAHVYLDRLDSGFRPLAIGPIQGPEVIYAQKIETTLDRTAADRKQPR
jgi:hypothetical protein